MVFIDRKGAGLIAPGFCAILILLWGIAREVARLVSLQKIRKKMAVETTAVVNLSAGIGDNIPRRMGASPCLL